MTSSISIFTSADTFLTAFVLTGYGFSSSLSSSDSDLGAYFVYLAVTTYFVFFTGALTGTSLILIL